MTQRLGTEERPLRIAIIGAGPAGFYTAEALLKQKDLVCQIDFFNRLPTPFGLVRDGVAPDHQTIKSVIRVYERVANDPNVRYFGNVTFGVDLLHADIKPYYDQIVYAVGAQSDRQMGIAGEDLEGSYPATAFVGWYNGHPDYTDMQFDLSCERVVVVGNGNVAIDVARILVSSIERLEKTDIANHALQALRNRGVREVVMLGRRGPVQAAFTNAEIKELGKLDEVDIIVDPKDLELDEQSIADMENDKKAKRNVETLRSFAERTEHTAPRRIVLQFLVSPDKVIGSNGKVTGVRIEKNRLMRRDDGSLRPRGTNYFEVTEAGMVLRSVGYRTVPLKDVPFDNQRSVILNVAGRVLERPNGWPVPGEYVVGWAKRGPSGVIGTNKPDAVGTVAAMMEDLENIPAISDQNRDLDMIPKLLQEKNLKGVTYNDWKVLDIYELSKGSETGRPRIKVTTISDMLHVIDQQVTEQV